SEDGGTTVNRPQAHGWHSVGSLDLANTNNPRQMTLPLEHLEIAASPLGRWDARWKLAALVTAAIVAALVHTLPCALVAFAVALGLVLLGRLPPRWYPVRVGTLSLFLLFFVVWLPFLHDGGPT